MRPTRGRRAADDPADYEPTFKPINWDTLSSEFSLDLQIVSSTLHPANVDDYTMGFPTCKLGGAPAPPPKF